MEFEKYLQGRASAWRGHIRVGYELVRELRPRVVCELGVHWGHSLYTFAQGMHDEGYEGVIYGVDTFVGDQHTGGYGPEVLETVMRIRDEVFPELDIRILQGDFIEEMPRIRHKIDLLHIDGAHDYESVKSHFQAYHSKLREGACVLIHDIDVPHFGVNTYYQEIKQQYPNYSYTELHNDYGLAIIQTGDKPINIVTLLNYKQS